MDQSLWSPGISSEATINWTRSTIERDAEDPLSKTIPSIQINDLGMTGGPAERIEPHSGPPLSCLRGRLTTPIR